MTIPAPFDQYREDVRPEWIDYNGHMNVAYYVLAFDHATDAFLDFLGLDEAHRERTGGTTFAAEAHVTYHREVHAGDSLRFTSQLLGFDAKRIHYIHHMYHGKEGFMVATNEWLSLYVDLGQRRVVAMPADTIARLTEVMAAHGALPVPPQVGRAIRLTGTAG